MKNFGLKQDAFVCEFSLDTLMGATPDAIQAMPLPKYPSVSRDMTWIVDQAVEIGAILSQIKAFAQKQSLIEDYFLFDVFEGASLGPNKKSVSFRVVYRSSTKTLTEKNIRKIHASLSKAVMEAFNASLPAE